MGIAADAVTEQGAELQRVQEAPALVFPPAIPEGAQSELLRMFRDPYLLAAEERKELVVQMRDAVAMEPGRGELRVLLGMALCVNFEAQDALEEMREAVRLSPDSYIAHLKFGELLMRLRICEQAAEETRTAAELAGSPLQTELARRQAATIRTMQREGIERGGYGKVLGVFRRMQQLAARMQPGRSRAALEA